MMSWRWRSPREQTVAGVVCAVTLALIAWAHAAFFDPPGLLHISDEGYIQAFSARLLQGQALPYVDAVSHRGPVLYWTAALSAWLFGTDSWLSVRILALASMWLTALLLFLSARAARRPFAGAVAVIAVALTCLVAMDPVDGMAFNGECLLNVFAVAALLCATLGLRDRPAKPRLGYLTLAGGWAALAALCKQSGVAVALACAMWVASAAIARPSLRRAERWQVVGCYAAGVAAPAVVTALRYLIAGELGTLYYYTVTYNIDVYMAPLSAADKWESLQGWLVRNALWLALGLALVVWGAARPLARGWREFLSEWDQDGFAPTVALGALLSLILSNVTLRDFSHYYVQLVPWFGLLLGLVLTAAIRQHPLSAGHRGLLQAAVLVPAIAAMLLGSTWKEKWTERFQRRWGPKIDPICLAVHQRSAPSDALFVWGFRPDLYTWCQRRPASRYVYTTFVAGFVPWHYQLTKEQEDALAVPGSRELLLAELEESKPPVLINAAGSMGGRSISRYERLADYVERHYCPSGSRHDFEFYLRRLPDGGCPPPL